VNRLHNFEQYTQYLDSDHISFVIIATWTTFQNIKVVEILYLYRTLTSFMYCHYQCFHLLNQLSRYLSNGIIVMFCNPIDLLVMLILNSQNVMLISLWLLSNLQ
jgi:alkyl sulfatase BDS1-like metallo-beta-lactamase superfamily hydrolase